MVAQRDRSVRLRETNLSTLITELLRVNQVISTVMNLICRRMFCKNTSKHVDEFLKSKHGLYNVSVWDKVSKENWISTTVTSGKLWDFLVLLDLFPLTQTGTVVSPEVQFQTRGKRWCVVFEPFRPWGVQKYAGWRETPTERISDHTFDLIPS